MSLPGTKPKTQQDIVNDELATQVNEVTEKLALPGIEELHKKSKEEVASVLANLLKSRAGVKRLEYVVGSHVELTYNGNPMGQLRD